MFSIDVKIEGTEDVMRALDKLGAELTNFDNALDIIGTKIVRYVENDVFDSQGSVLGYTWPKLASSTQASKKKNYRSYFNVPLMATGTMRTAFFSKALDNNLTVGNKQKYFMYHQSTQARTKIPWRPMLWFNNNLRRMIETTLKADIDKKIESVL